jgi:hypothetical protein
MTGRYTSHEAVGETLLTQVGARMLHKPLDLARLNTTVARLAHQLPRSQSNHLPTNGHAATIAACAPPMPTSRHHWTPVPEPA